MRDFESIIAEDGKTGLRLARQYLPDVLLLDLMLPDITGFEVCRQLRRLSTRTAEMYAGGSMSGTFKLGSAGLAFSTKGS